MIRITQKLQYAAIFFLFLLVIPAYGFTTDTISISQVTKLEWYNLMGSIPLYEGEKSLSDEAFLNADNLDTTSLGKSDKSYWYQLVVRNNGADTANLYFYQNYRMEISELYEVRDGKPIFIGKSGALIPFSERILPRHPEAMVLELAPFEEKHVLVQQRYLTNHPVLLSPHLLSENAFIKDLEMQDDHLRKYMGLSMAFQGAVWIMMLYMLLLYFQNNRDTTFLTYALYLFTAMLYLVFKVGGNGPYFFALPNQPLLRYTLNEPLQFAMSISYNLFAIRFLNIKKQKPWLYKTMVVVNWVYGIYAILITSYFIFTKDVVTVNALFGPTRLIMLITGITLIVLAAIKLRGPLVGYLVIGSTVFLLGNLTAIYFSVAGMAQFNIPLLNGLGPISFTQIGIFLEMICFSLGIGKMIQINNREKEEIKDAYIEQLVENEKLNIRINQKLEETIAERTKEVLDKSKELENERSAKIKVEYERQLVESEMNSLRLQMNPHFIFNSLNSIRYFILKQDGDKAVDYITSFSKLLRMILHHSKQFEISLHEELEALKLYMMFESERFSEKFQYHIHISDKVDTGQTRIQPLLIQPFVENAIWHGLMHREKAGTIDIFIEKPEADLLKIVVEDDGIGRTKAAKLKSKKHGNQKSYGMQITKSRLEAMHKINGGRGGFEVEDLVDENGAPKGTRITLIIKTNQYESADY